VLLLFLFVACLLIGELKALFPDRDRDRRGHGGGSSPDSRERR
jgi:hypothetical protein